MNLLLWLLASTVASAADVNANKPKNWHRAYDLNARYHGSNTSAAESPPFYPSPWMNPNADGWAAAYAQAEQFVSQMTLMEKVNLTTGVGYVCWRQRTETNVDLLRISD